MNFEFKSTFNEQQTRARSLRSCVGFLALNALSLAVIAWLYLSNHLLPAAIVSKPYGLSCFGLALAALAVKMCGGALHAIALFSKSHVPVRQQIARFFRCLKDLVSSSQRYLYAARSRSSLDQTQKL